MRTGNLPPDSYKDFGTTKDKKWRFFQKQPGEGFISIKVVFDKGRIERANYWISYIVRSDSFMYRRDFILLMNEHHEVLEELCLALGTTIKSALRNYDPTRLRK